jgi:predicted O-methyltransferase YrrM
MYNASQLAIKFIRYYLRSSNGKGHGTHSPFIFNFITKVLNDKKPYADYTKAESLRKRLLSDPGFVSVEDFGAGSVVSKAKHRSIKSIARNAAKSKKFGQLLFRMANYFQPSTILEMGTSLGITTSYLSLACPDSSLITMEGAKEIASLAKQNFRQLELKNIQLIEGNFNHTLPGLLNSTRAIDFAFIDGNHRRVPTEHYFNLLLSHLHNDSILVFDDIHWSKEMEQAWETIKAHKAVRCTIDLFFIGIVVFRNEFREKQHFTIRF